MQSLDGNALFCEVFVLAFDISPRHFCRFAAGTRARVAGRRRMRSLGHENQLRLCLGEFSRTYLRILLECGVFCYRRIPNRYRKKDSGEDDQHVPHEERRLVWLWAKMAIQSHRWGWNYDPT